MEQLQFLMNVGSPARKSQKCIKGVPVENPDALKNIVNAFRLELRARIVASALTGLFSQNNESITNKKVISQLRHIAPQHSTSSGSILGLYPLYLSQDNQHLGNIVAENNPLNLERNWLEKCAAILTGTSLSQNSVKIKIEEPFQTADILLRFIDILDQLDKSTTENIEPLQLQQKKLPYKGPTVKDEHQINKMEEDELKIGQDKQKKTKNPENIIGRNIVIPKRNSHVLKVQSIESIKKQSNNQAQNINPPQKIQQPKQEDKDSHNEGLQ